MVVSAGLDFVFHMFFLVKYCKALEEGSFRSRSADFLWMLVFGAPLLHELAAVIATRCAHQSVCRRLPPHSQASHAACGRWRLTALNKQPTRRAFDQPNAQA